MSADVAAAAGAGVARVAAVEVEIGEVSFTGAQVISVSTQTETASPLTDAIRRASSSAGAEASVTLADAAFALSPWRRPDSMVGQRINIWSGPSYRAMRHTFTGVVMTASGSATSNEVELTCLDKAAWWMRDTGLKAGPVEGSAAWVIDQIAQTGGYGCTPRPIRTWPDVTGRTEASMLGSTAPNYGTIVPLRPRHHWASFEASSEPGRGEVMVSGSAAYEFDHATASPATHALYLQVYGDFAGLRDPKVTGHIVRDIDYDGPYFQIHMRDRTGSNNRPSYLRLYPYIGGDGNPYWGIVPRYITDRNQYLVDIPHVAGMGIRVRLESARAPGGRMRISTSAGYSQAVNLGDTVLPEGSAEPRLVFHVGWLERDRRGQIVDEIPVGWEQGAFAHAVGSLEDLPDAFDWIASIPGGVDYSPSLSELRYHPDLDHGWEHMQQAAQGEGGACWITRDGTLTFRNREDLLYGRKDDVPKIVDSYTAIMALSWEQSVTDIATAVRVAHRGVSTPRPRYVYIADEVKQVTDDDLEAGGGIAEEEVTLDNYVVLDLEAGLFTYSRFRRNPFKPGTKSYYAVHYRAVSSGDDTERVATARMNVRAELVDAQTILLRYSNPRPAESSHPDREGDEWYLSHQSDPDSPKLGVWANNAIRINPEIVIHAPGHAETTRDQPALAVHEEEHNVYRQDGDYVYAFAMFLAGQYSSRAPIADGLQIVPDDTLELGQSIEVHEPTRTNVSQRMVILADQRETGSSVSHSITAAPMLWRWDHGDFEDEQYWRSLIAGDVTGIPFATGSWSLDHQRMRSGTYSLRCNSSGELVLTEPRPVPRSRRVVIHGWARGMGAPLLAEIDWAGMGQSPPSGNLDRGHGAEVRLDVVIQKRSTASASWVDVDRYRLYDDRVAATSATETYGRWRGFGAPLREKIRVGNDRAFNLGNDAHQWRAVIRVAMNDLSPEAFWLIDDIDLREV